jgi:hypothetical protein
MPDGLTEDEFDSLAAEYVLGTLDADERTRANVLIDVDESFGVSVRLWERRFGELHLMVEPVDPEPHIWDRIRTKAADLKPSLEGQPEADLKFPDLEKLLEAELAKPAPALAPEQPTQPAEPELPPPLEWTAEQEPRPGRTEGPEPAPAADRARLPEPDRAPEPARRPSPEVFAREPALAVRPEARPAPPVMASGQEVHAGRRGLRRWRFVALFMTLVVLLLGGLISAWRFAPERLPPRLRPTAILNLPEDPSTPPLPRRPLPPGFDE